MDLCTAIYVLLALPYMLAQKFDALVDELKAIRAELSARRVPEIADGESVV